MWLPTGQYLERVRALCTQARSGAFQAQDTITRRGHKTRSQTHTHGHRPGWRSRDGKGLFSTGHVRNVVCASAYLSAATERPHAPTLQPGWGEGRCWPTYQPSRRETCNHIRTCRGPRWRDETCSPTARANASTQTTRASRGGGRHAWRIRAVMTCPSASWLAGAGVSTRSQHVPHSEICRSPLREVCVPSCPPGQSSSGRGRVTVSAHNLSAC